MDSSVSSNLQLPDSKQGARMENINRGLYRSSRFLAIFWAVTGHPMTIAREESVAAGP